MSKGADRHISHRNRQQRHSHPERPGEREMKRFQFRRDAEGNGDEHHARQGEDAKPKSQSQDDQQVENLSERYPQAEYSR